MPADRYDVIVVGLGGMGSAACYHLARRGHRVLGLERYSIPHEKGSSHGHSRIIRLAYFEHPDYVPLLRRAFELWRELEAESGLDLLRMTGCLHMGPPDGEIVPGTLRSCAEHQLAHEVLESQEVSRRFPAVRPPAGVTAILEEEGGYLNPERCIEAHAAGARAAGAELRTGAAVAGWESGSRGVRVTTEDGERFDAGRLVFATGSWTGKLLAPLADHLEPERQVVAWLDCGGRAEFDAGRLPVWLAEDPDGAWYYGFPAGERPGLKVGRYHHLREAVDPDRVDRAVHPRDVAALRDFTGRWFPDAAGPVLEATVCLFTNSPDGHFFIDRLPGSPEVVVLAGFSGHGFKFCSVVGEVAAGLVEDRPLSHNLDLFSLNRIGGGISS